MKNFEKYPQSVKGYLEAVHLEVVQRRHCDTCPILNFCVSAENIPISKCVDVFIKWAYIEKE